MWFRSYLSGRTYRVVYAGGTSSVVYIVCSVPQGSVLGPILYVADFADIINRHGVTVHSFADDTQLYVHCCREDIISSASFYWLRHTHSTMNRQPCSRFRYVQYRMYSTVVAQVAERHHLHSISRHLLVVPRFQLDTYGRHTFAVAGPTTWNLFHDNLHEPDMSIDCFLHTLKTFLFEQYSAHRAL